MALWVSCGSIRDRKITVQGFSLPKICTRISCFLQIKLSLNPDSAGLSFPCILSKPSCTLRLCGNPIFWKLSKSASASYPPSAELSTFPKTTKVQLSGAFFLFHFCVRSWPRWFIAGLFWHVAPYQFCEKPPLGNMSRNKRKKKGTYKTKTGGRGCRRIP